MLWRGDYIMMKFVFERNKIKTFNQILGEKNEISILKNYDTKVLEEEDKKDFIEMGILTPEGNVKEEIKSGLELLAKPKALVNIMFTGGVARYDHSICFDKNFQKQISFTATPSTITIDEESDSKDVLGVFEEFVGKSNLKSVGFYNKFDIAEALVIASMLDMERRASLRAFVDEFPYNRNLYNSNIIWRMINSTNPSIQWFVYCINEVVGEHIPLSQKQVQEALEQLSDKGIITKQENQYQLSSELCLLANRMIIVDNVITVEALSINDENEIIGSGFTCIQSGIHDLLMLDYDGNNIIFETVNSVRLLEYMERFLNAETFYSKTS